MIGWFTRASYMLWPTKRRWSNTNFGHVLGKPPDSPAVRKLALRAYATYARYLVELMRLPRLSQAQAATLVDGDGLDGVERFWRSSKGVVLAICHVGNNEVVAAGVANRGWPISVVADDSAFPELFEILRRQRESWGAHVIPWRNLREVYGVLRRHELLALLVDWGYRDDGIPVKLFGAWTTLPAGPAALAAKTGCDDPADRHPAPAQRPLPGRARRADQRAVEYPGRHPGRVAGGGRGPRADHQRRARPVVQLQADVAGDRRPRPGMLAARAERMAANLK